MIKAYLIALTLVCQLNQRSSGQEAVASSFRRHIAPILLDNCLACHSAKKAEGGYRLDSYEMMCMPGDSGAVPIAMGSELSGELLRRICSQDSSERMPPDTEPLPNDKIQLIKDWIFSGGKFDGDVPTQTLALVIPPTQYADPPETYSQPIPITATTFSPDGKLIITGGYHELLVWTWENSHLVRRITNIGQRVYGLAFSPDGLTLAAACGEPGRNGEVRLVDFQSGTIQGVVARSGDVALDLAYRPGTKELAVASADSTIRIVNVDTLQEIRSIASHADWVTSIAYSDDGTRLVSSSRDKSAKVYDAATGDLISSYQGHAAAVRGASILAGNSQVVSVGADNKLHRWEIDGAKKVAEVDLGGEGLKLIRFATYVLVSCSDKRLLRIDLNSNAIAREFKGHSDWVLTSCCPPNLSVDALPSIVASGAFDGEVRIWNGADAATIRSWIAKP